MGLAGTKIARCLAPLGLVCVPHAATAQGANHAVGADIFFSTDTDDTQVARLAAQFDLRNDDPEHRIGLRLEKAIYDFQGLNREERDRVYLQAADVSGGWSWNVRAGTDGDTLIGSASVHDDTKFRKEFFAERDVVETPQGLSRGLYSTFVGALIDLPVDDRNIVTVLTGIQEFTGANERLHVRANYIHVLNPALGLSAQIRGRYFYSTHPREYDYYSPRWYSQLLPVLQMRRFIDGWELLGAGGVGAQRDSSSKWRRSDFAQFRIRTPAMRVWSGYGELTYSSSPSDSSAVNGSYGYFQSMIGVTRRF